MALITYDAFSGTVQTADPVSWAHTCSGVSRLLVVGVSHHSAQAIVTVKYNAVAMTRIGNEITQDVNQTSLWYLINPTSGANNIVIDYSLASGTVAAAISFNNAMASSQPRAYNSDQGAGGNPSHVVTSLLNDIVVSFVSNFGNATTFAPGGGQTERYDNKSNGQAGAISHETGAGATVTSSWTIADSGNWVQISASFRTPRSGSQAIIIM